MNLTTRSKVSPLITLCLANLACGALLALAFAPFNLALMAILCPMAAFGLWQKSSNPVQALLLGGSFGLGLWCAGIYWITVPIHDYGDGSWILAISLSIGFMLFMSVFFAIQSWLFNRFTGQYPWLVFATLWTLMEWLRGWILTGFPWLYISYAHLNTPLKGWVPIVGFFGVSFISVLLSSLLYQMLIAIRSKRQTLISLGFASVIIGGGWSLSHIHWTQATGAPISVIGLQANIPQDEKWQAHYYPLAIERHVKLTQKYIDHDLIIWPESALVVPLPNSRATVDSLDRIAKQHHSSLLVGVPINAGHHHYYNAVVGLGDIEGVYSKRHLLPFGDFLPFEQYLRGLIQFFNLPMSSFIQGSDRQPLFMLHGHPLALLICYEIAYSNLVLQDAQQAQVLITVSNDTWFGRTSGPWQHFQIAQMQALLTGKPLVRVTNNGITAIIGPDGQVQTQLPQFQEKVLDAMVQPMQFLTPITRFGNTVVISFIVLLLLISQIKSIPKKVNINT